MHDKAGALLRSMIKNHPFIDGNKRIGLVTTIDFLLMNDHIFFATDADMVQFALEIAKSEPDMPWEDVAAWIRRNCVSSRATQEEVSAKVKNRPQDVIRRLQQIQKALDEAREEMSLSS